MNSKRKTMPVDRLAILEAVTGWLLVTVIIVALVLAMVMPAIQWQADMQACMRMLGLTEQNCADYLRLVQR